jgi:hypothetical protein
MKMYCVYGHGKETERSYWYDCTLIYASVYWNFFLCRYAQGEYERDDTTNNGNPSCTSPSQAARGVRIHKPFRSNQDRCSDGAGLTQGTPTKTRFRA